MDKKPECLLFLSWQSDRKDCRNFVSSVLEKMPQKVSDLVTITVDRDTANVAGSPDIEDTIFEKIDRCDLFIADVTLINDEGCGFRLTPNPNVMIELGYAIKTLGWERILLLQCEDYGDVEQLPFDINHRRICNFTLALNKESGQERMEQRRQSKQTVSENIATSIKLLLDKNLLFGGKKGKIPKFEMKWKGHLGYMMNLSFGIKNVSSIMVSGLRSHGLVAIFSDVCRIEIPCNPHFDSSSLAPGEETVVKLNNQMLGAGDGHSNAFWTNIDLQWQFSCEDEENNVYWYEMSQHIESANAQISWQCPVRYIG